MDSYSYRDSNDQSAEDRGDSCEMVIIMHCIVGRGGGRKTWCIRMSRTACCTAWPQIAPYLGRERELGGPLGDCTD